MEIEFSKHLGTKLMEMAMSSPKTAKTLADNIGETAGITCLQLFEIMANCHDTGCDTVRVIIRMTREQKE